MQRREEPQEVFGRVPVITDHEEEGQPTKATGQDQIGPDSKVGIQQG